MAELPELVRPLEQLLGTWHGEGVGAVPGGRGPDFPYVETLTLSCDGGAEVAYSTRAVAVDDGRLLHAESGWWRPQPDGEVEVVLCTPLGVAEVLVGGATDTPAGPSVELSSDVVARTSTAPQFNADHRLYAVRGDRLMYVVELAVGGSPLAPHLSAALERVEG